MGACELGPGDEVITVSHTAPATAFAIELSGATPVFVDVDPATYTMDPACAAEAIGPRTRGLVPVHLYGQCADMNPLRRLAEEHGLWLVEDAAQAHGARYGGARAGTLGQLGCFSFYPTKNLGAYGDGGGVVTDDRELARRLRLLRDYGRTAENCHEIVAGNSRFDELQAAMLRVKLTRLDGWNDTRRRLASIYAERLADLPLELPVAEDRGEHVYHLYVVRTPRRDELQAYLRANGVGAGVHYPLPVHLQPAWQGRPVEWPLPVTEECAEEILSLPMYPELSEGDAEHVAELVRGFFR
jgi:dTDP-4-amino-4,6-dideoxygalactose transaminase